MKTDYYKQKSTESLAEINQIIRDVDKSILTDRAMG